MIDTYTAHLIILLIFAVGYLGIIFEYSLKVNKTSSALVMAVLCWMFVFFVEGRTPEQNVHALGEHLNEISQIILFLLGAMTLVELIDSHKGFKVITDVIHTNSKRKLLWILGFTTFFLSSVLDNLTTSIVMISLLRKLVPDQKERWMLGSMAVIAANAGGAWTPIGDVTTTMLWINGNITTGAVMKWLFFPSVISLAVALFLFGIPLKGKYAQLQQRAHEDDIEPSGRLIFFAGIGALVFVPVFKALTGLPPFMGILIALGVLWLMTDILHRDDETRNYLRVPHVLTKIDTSGVLFFLGILLSIGALDTLGYLRELAEFLHESVGNINAIAVIIGVVSSVIDNVPLVAAGMGMFDLAQYPADSTLWQMLAYCAGTGGSILIIGSAAGVALMGLEKVDFMWYLKRISLIALVSYFAGVLIFMAQLQLVGG